MIARLHLPLRVAVKLARAAVALNTLVGMLAVALAVAAFVATVASGIALLAASVAGATPVFHRHTLVPATIVLEHFTDLSVAEAMMAIALLAAANVIVVGLARVFAAFIGQRIPFDPQLEPTDPTHAHAVLPNEPEPAGARAGDANGGPPSKPRHA